MKKKKKNRDQKISLCSSTCCGVTWPVLTGPILGLLYAFLSLDYSDPTLSLGLHSCYLGFLDPFHCLRASLAHFFFLRHPRPTFFPWTFLAHSNSAFSWAFVNSFGLPRPNYYILYLCGLGLSINPLLTYFITLGLPRSILAFILTMGLLLLSLGYFRPACFLQGPFIILWAFDPSFLPFGLNGFSLNLLTLFCPYCWASSYCWALPKWASTPTNH